FFCFFFQAEDGIRDFHVTGVQTCALPIFNVGFVHVPLIHGWPPMSLAVGLVFVLRDFAQREVGHKVLFIMLIGAAISYLMASPRSEERRVGKECRSRSSP